MVKSKIEWCDRSDWNPIRGCARASEGCRNCYSEQIAARFSDPGQPFHGFATRSPARWTGKVELMEDRLTLPLKWRKPARIFINSASDLFHEDVLDEWIDRVFAVMALCPQHTFMVLTKRAERMREYLSRASAVGDICANISWIAGDTPISTAALAVYRHLRDETGAWPLPNVMLGVSIENQKAADERIPHLLATPAAVRFISAEPLLGKVDLRHVRDGAGTFDALSSKLGIGYGIDNSYARRIDWAIVGGETGPNARPMHPEWVRSLRDQCAAAGTPFFFKGFGAFAPGEFATDWMRVANGEVRHGFGDHESVYWAGYGADAGAVALRRVGKKLSGRLLDGKEHNGMPECSGDAA